MRDIYFADALQSLVFSGLQPEEYLTNMENELNEYAPVFQAENVWDLENRKRMEQYMNSARISVASDPSVYAIANELTRDPRKRVGYEMPPDATVETPETSESHVLSALKEDISVTTPDTSTVQVTNISVLQDSNLYSYVPTDHSIQKLGVKFK